jgi:hypothetical protein
MSTEDVNRRKGKGNFQLAPQIGTCQ